MNGCHADATERPAVLQPGVFTERRGACSPTATMNAVAYRQSASELEDFHAALGAFNRRRLTPTFGATGWRRDLADEHAWRLREGDFVAAQAPSPVTAGETT